jgi:LysM repeat protein
MRRRLAISLVTLGLVAACGGGAPTDIFVESPEPTAEPTPEPTAAPVTGKRYKVKKNDTMYDIAVKFGITLKALKKANPKVDPNKMRVGTILIIPGN